VIFDNSVEKYRTYGSILFVPQISVALLFSMDYSLDSGESIVA